MNKTNKFKLVIIFILILLIFKNIVFATDSTQYPYGVWTNGSYNDLINTFVEDSLWAYLANGVENLDIVATPALLELVDTYDYLAGTNYNTTTFAINKDELGDYYDLCVPNITTANGNIGYWLRTSATDSNLYYVDCVNGTLSTTTSDAKNIGIRPCIYLPLTTQYIETNGVITIVK